jgi:tetratricopeptide (TPR) repeat protein
MEGRFGDAKRAADDLAALYVPHFKRMPELENYAPTPLFVLLRFHRWKEILAFPQPMEEMHTTTALWHFSRAMAFANLGDVSQALKEKELFIQSKAKVPVEQAYGYNTAEKIFTIANYSLDSKLAEAQGNWSQAVELLQRAIDEQDKLRYNEPPDWFFPIRENLGAIYLKTKRPLEAELTFREDLRKHPRNGRALFGLRESLRTQGKEHDLYWVDKEFEQAWMYSDEPLTVNAL